jgi:hypothetical protein
MAGEGASSQCEGDCHALREKGLGLIMALLCFWDMGCLLLGIHGPLSMDVLGQY